MNASLFTANRNTHLKIVVIALIAAIAVASIAIRLNFVNTMMPMSWCWTVQAKCGKPGAPKKQKSMADAKSIEEMRTARQVMPKDENSNPRGSS